MKNKASLYSNHLDSILFQFFFLFPPSLSLSMWMRVVPLGIYSHPHIPLYPNGQVITYVSGAINDSFSLAASCTYFCASMLFLIILPFLLIGSMFCIVLYTLFALGPFPPTALTPFTLYSPSLHFHIVPSPLTLSDSHPSSTRFSLLHHTYLTILLFSNISHYHLGCSFFFDLSDFFSFTLIPPSYLSLFYFCFQSCSSSVLHFDVYFAFLCILNLHFLYSTISSIFSLSIYLPSPLSSLISCFMHPLVWDINRIFTVMLSISQYWLDKGQGWNEM